VPVTERPDPVLADPVAAEARGLAQLAWTGERIVEGVERVLPRWARLRVVALLEAWGEARPDVLAAAGEAAESAGAAAAERIVAELRPLLALDPERQPMTPLQVVRTAYREPAGVLRAHGVAPIVRDAFAERAWPDDDYGLVPDTFADLGDDDLAPMHLAWGVAKATVVRARRTRRAAP
jgi:hypothetical protein